MKQVKSFMLLTPFLELLVNSRNKKLIDTIIIALKDGVSSHLSELKESIKNETEMKQDESNPINNTKSHETKQQHLFIRSEFKKILKQTITKIQQ